jgi:hypothetical protein
MTLERHWKARANVTFLSTMDKSLRIGQVNGFRKPHTFMEQQVVPLEAFKKLLRSCGSIAIASLVHSHGESWLSTIMARAEAQHSKITLGTDNPSALRQRSYGGIRRYVFGLNDAIIALQEVIFRDCVKEGIEKSA